VLGKTIQKHPVLYKLEEEEEEEEEEDDDVNNKDDKGIDRIALVLN
jgi:CO dehydrogenase/acetyl-CoA synthase beta subunit